MIIRLTALTKAILTCIIFFSTILLSRSQSINGVWLATNSTNCIEFDSALHRMNIGDIHEVEWKTGTPKLIFKIKGNIMKIVWYYYNSRSVSFYRINYISGGKLSLSNVKEGEGAIEELMGGYEVEFIKTDTCNSCKEYYKKILTKNSK